MRLGRSIFDLELRVTFYARVSTDKYEQQSSLENQVSYYTELIRSRPNWTYVEGYIDEGISGTSTKNRDSFNLMVEHAKAGLFDFIITKEISRFSRSTLDSIKYTQELLEHNVGVYFQSDNINTLDPDSEFRLVVMAGVAQDEVRKLSERLKFGFGQSIGRGRVLGSDNIWGYDKSGGKLSVNEEEARIVRLIFELCADGGMGIRRISQHLSDMGCTSRTGGEFSASTIRNILRNPKYKGWYCGRKTRSIDYRSKKSVPLEKSEWVTYPDPDIPPIVTEELWERANAAYAARSAESLSNERGACFHNRYAYSGKIICSEHGATFHRQLAASGSGDTELWQCSEYRRRGRAGCSMPHLRTAWLDEVLSQIFPDLLPDRGRTIDILLDMIASAPDRDEHRRRIDRLRSEIAMLGKKKDRLLGLAVEGAVSTEEFALRNEDLNRRLDAAMRCAAELEAEKERCAQAVGDPEKIRAASEEILSCKNGMDPLIVRAILERITVREACGPGIIELNVLLKSGEERLVRCEYKKDSFRFNIY
jgi:DNA invertase Pin-like site-specific DNA recombinase